MRVSDRYAPSVTVHQRIVDPRLNFELFFDWLKTVQVAIMLVYDWMIPPSRSILYSRGQVLFDVL